MTNNSNLLADRLDALSPVLAMIRLRGDGQPAPPGSQIDLTPKGFPRVGELIEAVQLRAARRETMALVRTVNGYLAQAPWFVVIHAEKEAAATTVYSALQAIDSLTVLLAPFIPMGAERVHGALGYVQPLFGAQNLKTCRAPEGTHDVLIYDASGATGCWRPSTLQPGQPLAWSEPLYKKLDDTELGS